MAVTPDKVPPAPKGTGPSGKRLWDSVLAEYSLEEHEAALLRECVRTVDLLDDLDAAVAHDGLMVDSAQGIRVNPAAVEARLQRITLARLQSALRLPAGDEAEGGDVRRPQRRVGVRGVYGVREIAR